MSAVNLAIIGCGGMGGAHLNALIELRRKGLDLFNLSAVCDVVEARAKDFAGRAERELGRRPNVYTDFRRMLEQEGGLDAVDVATEHRSHHIIAVPCLEAGKHVIVEKPLAITMRACRLMIEKAERCGKVLATAENYRRAPGNRAIKWAVEQGKIGEPRLLFWIDIGYWLGYWGWRHDRMQAGGGWTLDGGVHYADLFLHILGEVEEVYASTKTFEPFRYKGWPERREPVRYNVEDAAISILRFKSGAIGQWTWTGVAPGEGLEHRVIHGAEGSISWQKGLSVLGPGNVGRHLFSMSELEHMMMSSLDADRKERLFPRGLRNDVAIELWDFAEAIINKRKPEVDGVMGAKAEAIPMAIFESSWSGEPVKVDKVEKCEIENYQREINESLGLC